MAGGFSPVGTSLQRKMHLYVHINSQIMDVGENRCVNMHLSVDNCAAIETIRGPEGTLLFFKNQTIAQAKTLHVSRGGSLCTVIYICISATEMLQIGYKPGCVPLPVWCVTYLFRRGGINIKTRHTACVFHSPSKYALLWNRWEEDTCTYLR